MIATGFAPLTTVTPKPLNSQDGDGRDSRDGYSVDHSGYGENGCADGGADELPQKVVQADRWAKDNKNLKGDQIKSVVDKQAWDGSVKSLVATPDVLAMMSAKLGWMLRLSLVPGRLDQRQDGHGELLHRVDAQVFDETSRLLGRIRATAPALVPSKVRRWSGSADFRRGRDRKIEAHRRAA